MSRIKPPSTTPSTPTRTALATLQAGASSISTGSAPPAKNTRWFIIGFADADDPEVEETLLCTVNPDNTLAQDATEIQTCLLAVFNKNSDAAGIQCVSVEISEGFRGTISVKASLKQLVMHLREVPAWETALSTELAEPNLWESGDNKVVVYFLDKSEAQDVTMDE